MTGWLAAIDAVLTFFAAGAALSLAACLVAGCWAAAQEVAERRARVYRGRRRVAPTPDVRPPGYRMAVRCWTLGDHVRLSAAGRRTTPEVYR